MLTVYHTLLVDELEVIHAADVVWVFLIVTTRAEFTRTVITCCNKVERQFNSW